MSWQVGRARRALWSKASHYDYSLLSPSTSGESHEAMTPRVVDRSVRRVPDVNMSTVTRSGLADQMINAVRLHHCILAMIRVLVMRHGPPSLDRTMDQASAQYLWKCNCGQSSLPTRATGGRWQAKKGAWPGTRWRIRANESRRFSC